MTDERAVPDNADEIQDESQSQGDQGRPEQETTGPPREAPPRGARPGDEGARLLRRVLQLEPAGVRWGPLELLVSYGRSGHRRHGAREGVPVRLSGGALPLAREPGAAAAVSGAGEIRQVRAVRRRDRLRATGRAAARPTVHQVQSEGRRWETPLTAGCSGRPRGRSSWPIWSPSSWPNPCWRDICRSGSSATSCRCAGAVGNVIDRIRSAQGVVDFVDVGIGGARWPTFNVADSAITVGAIALAVSLWLEGRAQERAKEAGAAQH